MRRLRRTVQTERKISSRFINFCQQKFKQLQTRQKILLGFSVPLLLMIVIATLVYFSIGKLADDTKWVQHTHQVIADGQELAKLMIDMETGERGFLITGKESFLEPFEKAQKVWDSRISSLKLLVADNPVQILRLARVDSLEKEWARIFSIRYESQSMRSTIISKSQAINKPSIYSCPCPQTSSIRKPGNAVI